MKVLIYRYFLNERYDNIEEKATDYDYVGSFLDEFGTSQALRMRAYVPKDEADRKKIDEMYEKACQYRDEWVESPETFLTWLDDKWHYFLQTYYDLLWFSKGLKERIFR